MIHCYHWLILTKCLKIFFSIYHFSQYSSALTQLELTFFTLKCLSSRETVFYIPRDISPHCILILHIGFLLFFPFYYLVFYFWICAQGLFLVVLEGNMWGTSDPIDLATLKQVYFFSGPSSYFCPLLETVWHN